MKARVLVPLNVRTGKPEILPDNNTGDLFLNPGDEVIIDEAVFGESYKGNNVWYKLEDGSFVWSGGVNKQSSALLALNSPLSNSNDLSQKIMLSNATLNKGQGIIIGVLDSGVDTRHVSLKNAIISYEDLLGSDAGEIANSHGTKVAGILVGNDARISGMVINSKIRSYRVVGTDEFTDEFALKKALENIIEKNINVDILNLSLDISSGAVPFFQPLVNEIALKGTVIIVAGNEGNIDQLNNIAQLKNVIVVGVFKAGEFNKIQTGGHSSIFNSLFLDTPLITTGVATEGDGHGPFASSSAYTALTSGIAAAYLSNQFIPANKRLAEVASFLKRCAFPAASDNVAVPFKLYK